MSIAHELEVKVVRRDARVAVIGLGYVGLPTAVAFAVAGFPVLGVDVDKAKVIQVKQGQSYIPEVLGATLASLVSGQAGEWPKLAASADYGELASADVVQICVPTPCTRNKEPDTSHIIAAARGIAANGRPGQLVILRSTSYPGTTRELVLPALIAAGRRVGEDTFVAFVPERFDPGRKTPPLEEVPVVVGGVDPLSTQLTSNLFGHVVERVIPVSSAEAAEMTKLLENVFRNVNIALVNQLAMLCDRMALDVWEIVDAAATKPYGFMKFIPGPGVGGHCIPVDPYYLAWKAREFDFHMDFIELAARVNDEMPYFAVGKILTALHGRQASVQPGRPLEVLVLGVTFKRDVPDERTSPAVKIIELLLRQGIQVAYHDPYVPGLTMNGRTLQSQRLAAESLGTFDGVVIATDHSNIDYQWVVDNARLVVDLRNATARIVRGRDHVVRL